MEKTEQDLQELEAELRKLAEQELPPREEDAALLARLMAHADAACATPPVSPWYRRRSAWGVAASLVFLSVLGSLLLWQYAVHEAVNVDLSAEKERAITVAGTPEFVTQPVGADTIPAPLEQLPQLAIHTASAHDSVLLDGIARMNRRSAVWNGDKANGKVDTSESLTLNDNGVEPKSEPIPQIPTAYSSATAKYSGGADVAVPNSDSALNPLVVMEDDCEEACEDAREEVDHVAPAMVVTVPNAECAEAPSMKKCAAPAVAKRAIRKAKVRTVPAVAEKVKQFASGCLRQVLP